MLQPGMIPYEAEMTAIGGRDDRAASGDVTLNVL
jgi:hypothetical protein